MTQQLARVPAAQLAACRQSVSELDELCSFRSANPDDYRDLNWWPAVLERTWESMGIDAQTLTVLKRAFGGAGEVNPAYRNQRDSVWEHPVTALEPPQVVEVAAALHALTPDAVHAAVPPDRGDPPELVAAQHAILRDFYDEAARRQLATVMWWD